MLVRTINGYLIVCLLFCVLRGQTKHIYEQLLEQKTSQLILI